MKPRRPIGANIRAACTVLERLGPSTANQVRAQLPGVNADNMRTYLTRAVGLGLVTVNRSRANTYTVAPDWDAKAAEVIPEPPPPKPIKRGRWYGVNSVFSMGAI
jgi:hypothetical protein